MPFTLNGIGTKVYGARGYVNWGQESYDAVEWFVILFVPIIPLKAIHTFGWNGSAYHQIPIRTTPGLLFASVCKGWFVELFSWVAPIIGVSCGFIFFYVVFFRGDDFRKALPILFFALFAGLLGGLIYVVSSMHRSLDKRHREIRVVLGPHQFGSSDPFTWTHELLSGVRSPQEMFGTDSFASAAMPLLNEGQLSRAMWAARFSAAKEDADNGEALTNAVLEDFRVQQAIEFVLEDRSRWAAVMTSKEGATVKQQVAEQVVFEPETSAGAEEVLEALPVQSPPNQIWAAQRISKTVGNCRHCGMGPVEQNVRACPYCMEKYPNPSPLQRACDWGVVIGGLLGAGVGLVSGLRGGIPGVVAGLVVGVFCGIIVGFVGGNIWGMIASLSGRNTQK